MYKSENFDSFVGFGASSNVRGGKVPSVYNKDLLLWITGLLGFGLGAGAASCSGCVLGVSPEESFLLNKLITRSSKFLWSNFIT